MKLQIERPYVDAMFAQFPSLTNLKEQLRFGNRAEISVQQLSASELSYLQNLYENAGPDMQGRAAQITTLQKALNDDSKRFSADDIEQVLPEIADYLLKDGIRAQRSDRCVQAV